MMFLQLHQVARYFGADVLFDNIQMEIKDNSRIALVGRNGVGKSTLLKIIAGVEKTDRGEVMRKQQLRIGYLAQNTGITSERTVYEEMSAVFAPLKQMEARMRDLEAQMADNHEEAIFKEYDRLQHSFQEQNGYGYESEIRSVLHGFHFDESYYTLPVANLSGGEKTRLALAKMLLEKPDLLILDEPTNHLDIETLMWLEQYLSNYKGALLIVSHDRYFLDRIVNEVYELERHEITHYTGNYSDYMRQKSERLAQQAKQYQQQQRDIKKMEVFIAKNMARSSTTKRAQSRRKQLEKMHRIEAPKGPEKSMNVTFPIREVSGNVVLEVENATVGYPDEVLSDHIQLDIKKQEAVALIGPNGIGKSTLLKSITNQIPLLAGEVHFGSNVSVGYYDQEHANLHENKTVLQELWDEHPTTPEKDIRTVLASFLFYGDDVQKVVHMLSGGERARLTLAKLSMEAHNFLILDEPTNHLDIESKEALEDALIHFEGTILFVSHDRYFINRLATKVVELDRKGTTVYLGDYDYFVEKKEELEAQRQMEAQEEVQSDEPVVASQPLSREMQKKRRQLERQLERVEQEIDERETAIATLQKEMNDEALANDSYSLARKQEEIDEHEEALLVLTEEWESIGTELETL